MLGFFDAASLVVGIVVGAGIFSFPSLVAANSGGAVTFIGIWIAGGVASLIGALCYAELAAAFPSAGGDYTFLKRAFGERIAFLFAWARMSVIQTGSAAILAFVFGDYAAQVLGFGGLSSFVFAAGVIVALTAVNIAGIRFGTGMQKILTLLEIAGIVAVIAAGFLFAPETVPESNAAADSKDAALGMAFIFAMLTFGGWNEAAYVSAEMKSGGKGLAKALIFGIVIVTALYLLINLAYVNVLGLGGIAGSKAVAADLMRLTLGEDAARLIALMIAVAALTSANATLFTGARTNFALGRDFPLFARLGRWNERANAPVNAFLIQGAVALLLIGLGYWTRDGIKAIVDYTAPVFWMFFFLTGIALFVLRRKEPGAARPFRVPLYPLTPILFCLTSLYLLYSAITYAGLGTIVSLAVLATGSVLLIAAEVVKPPASSCQTSPNITKTASF